MKEEIKYKIDNIKKLIGNTPMFKITYEYLGKVKEGYFKAEWFNFTGSIKDRMAINILEKAYEREDLKEGEPIVEITSGNTGIALSTMAKILGNKAYIIMPENVSVERRELIKSVGAELFIVSEEEGGQDACYKLKEKIIKEKGAFATCQHDNFDNIDTYYNFFSKEIEDQLKQINKKITAFVAGVGTGGTFMGTCKYFKEKDNNFLACAVEPAESPVLKGKINIANHKMEGLNVEFKPSIMDASFPDQIFDISSDDAINMARKISKELGLGVGISSGANFLGVVLANQLQKENATTVSVFADNNKKYLSTELFNNKLSHKEKLNINNENLKNKKDLEKTKTDKDFISNKIKLISFEVI